MFLKGAGAYTHSIKAAEDDISACVKKVNELAGIKESDTGLAVPALWDLAADKQALQTEEPLQVSISKRKITPLKKKKILCLQVARCTKIIDAGTEHPKYMIHVKQFAKFVVNLHKNLAPTDVEEGMRVGSVPSPTHVPSYKSLLLTSFST